MTETQTLQSRIAELPKAELHLHLEGSLSPATVSLLGSRHGVSITHDAAEARYTYTDFAGFLESFKWATGYLKMPEDYSLAAHRLADDLLRQNIERSRGNGECIHGAVRDGPNERRAFEKFIARRWENDTVRARADPVTRSTDALQRNGDRTRRPDLND